MFLTQNKVKHLFSFRKYLSVEQEIVTDAGGDGLEAPGFIVEVIEGYVGQLGQDLAGELCVESENCAELQCCGVQQSAAGRHM